jgi:hypothetical protein
MDKKSSPPRRFRRIFFAVFLGTTFLVPALGAKERRGDRIVVTKNNGTTIEGELLTVRELNLIIADSSTIGITVSLADVTAVKVLRRRKVGTGLAIGILVGGASGGTFGYATANHTGFLHDLDEAGRAGYGALIGACAGGLIGLIAGDQAGTTKHISIRTTDPASLNMIAKSLRKYARVRS